MVKSSKLSPVFPSSLHLPRRGKYGPESNGGKSTMDDATTAAFHRLASCKACCNAGRKMVASRAPKLLPCNSSTAGPPPLIVGCGERSVMVVIDRRGVPRLTFGPPRFGVFWSFNMRNSFSYISISCCITSMASVSYKREQQEEKKVDDHFRINRRIW